MPQLIVPESPSVVIAPYTRGIPAEIVARGLGRRFIPASVGIMCAFSLLPLADDPKRVGIVLSIMTMETACVVLGYGATLAGMRRWLYPDAGIDGRRSVVAGLFSPLALGIASVFSQGHSELIAPLSLLAGAGMALVMFFPWLRPTPSRLALTAASDDAA